MAFQATISLLDNKKLAPTLLIYWSKTEVSDDVYRMLIQWLFAILVNFGMMTEVIGDECNYI